MSTKTEAEFVELAQKIQAKMDEAVKALKEANDIARSAGTSINSCRYMCVEDNDSDDGQREIEGVNVYGLFDQIANAGWSSSSLTC